MHIVLRLVLQNLNIFFNALRFVLPDVLIRSASLRLWEPVSVFSSCWTGLLEWNPQGILNPVVVKKAAGLTSKTSGRFWSLLCTLTMD